MNKLLLLCPLILLLAMLVLPVSAAETSGSCGDNLTWTLENGVLTVTGTGPMTNYRAQTQPEWDDSRLEVTELVIGEGVTTIGSNAFKRFENMTKVILPGTLKEIGGTAFLWAKSLTSITLPDSVTYIASLAFNHCEALEEIVIPANAEIRSDAFAGCKSLKKVTFKGGGKVFFDAFKECVALKDIYFLGDAPELMDPFADVTANAWYSVDNVTWTEDKRQDYGGKLTWKCYCNHIETSDAAVPASCTKTGLTEGKHCSVCGKILVAQQTIPADGHKYGPWTQVKAPSTQEMGEEQRKCSVCGDVQQRDLPKLPETPTQPPTEPPTQPPTEPPTEPKTESPTNPPTEPYPTKGPTEPAQGDNSGQAQGLPQFDLVVILIAGTVVLAAGGGAAWLLIIRKRQ